MTHRPKVFGIGLNKTGTTTLGACMKALGYAHLSHSETNTRLYYDGQLGKLMEVARRYDSFEDWPWPLIYKELATEFPDAKFVLTIRKSPETWLKSLTTHSYKLPPAENYHEMVYGYKYLLGHKQYHLDFYNNHNQEVKEYFKDHPERLLTICWEDGDDWTRLCDFLRVKMPEKEFPHVGASKDWPVPKSRQLHNLLLALKDIGASNQLKYKVNSKGI